MTVYKLWGGSAWLGKRLGNCVCRQGLNLQEHAAASATVSVCNNSASLIGFCGFPITPSDLHKSNGPLLNLDPAAYSRRTPLSSTGPKMPHSKKKIISYWSHTVYIQYIYIKHSRCVQPCCNNFPQSQNNQHQGDDGENTWPMTSWAISVSFPLKLDLKDLKVTWVPKKGADLDMKARAREGGCCVQQHTPLPGDSSFLLCLHQILTL